MIKRLLSVQEAASLLKVNSQTLRRWDSSGILVPLRTEGNQRRYTRKQIREFSLDRRSHKALSKAQPVSDTPHSIQPQTELYQPAHIATRKGNSLLRISEQTGPSGVSLPKWLSYTVGGLGIVGMIFVVAPYILNSELIQNSNLSQELTARYSPQNQQSSHVLSAKNGSSEDGSLSWKDVGISFLEGFAQVDQEVRQTVAEGLFGSTYEDNSDNDDERILGISSTTADIVQSVRNFFAQWFQPINNFIATRFTQTNLESSETISSPQNDQGGVPEEITGPNLSDKVATLEADINREVELLTDEISDVKSSSYLGTNKNSSLIASLEGKTLELGRLVAASDKSYVSLTLTKTLQVGGNTTIKGTTTIDGDVVFNSALTVDNTSKQITLGTISIHGGDLKVPGTTTLKGNTIFGDGTDDLIALTGRISTSIIPNLSAALDLGSSDLRWKNLYVNNLIANTQTISGISTTGDVTVGGTLGVTGASTLSSTLNVTGAITGPTSTNTINGLVISSGALSSVTGITASGGYTQSGSSLNYFSGNVGIGYSVPGGSLGVAGNLGVGFSYARFTPPTNGLMVEGSLGVGTTSPSASLSVGSTSQFQVNSSGAIAAATAVTSSGTITFSGLGVGVVLSSSTGVLSNSLGTANYVTKWTTTGLSTTSLVYDDGTNVGVGTTSPGSKLGVAGGLGVGISYSTLAAPTNGLLVQGSVGVGTTTAGSTFNINGNTVIGFGLGSVVAPSNGLAVNGSVGIGVSSPSNTLAISGSVGIGYSYARAAGPTNGLSVEGNVGIGTTSPGPTLDVTGTGRFFSTLTASDGLT